MTNPVDIPELYEHVILKGVVSPGICEVTGGARPFKWDVESGKGSSGATSKYQGQDLAKPSVRFQLWKEAGDDKADHFAQWEANFRPILDGMIVDGKPEATDIYHPALEANGIRSVTLAQIGQLEHVGLGLYEIVVDFIEYRPPKPAGGTPKGSKGPGANAPYFGDPGARAGSSLGEKAADWTAFETAEDEFDQIDGSHAEGGFQA